MKTYHPRRTVFKFTDLEVYQQTLACSVIIVKNLRPALAKLKYPFLEGIINCSMTAPLLIGEAHSLRFGDHARALLLLERAMADCNKLVVYLEQARSIYGSKLDQDLVDDLSRRYTDVRGKIFRLEKAWQKFTPPKQ